MVRANPRAKEAAFASKGGMKSEFLESGRGCKRIAHLSKQS